MRERIYSDRRLAGLHERRSGGAKASRTEATTRLPKSTLAATAAVYPEQPGVDYQRPRTRGECPAEGPCPFVSCRFNLYLDVVDSGSIQFNFPDLEVDDLVETCALDIADRGPVILEEVAQAMNLTRERVRQIEASALAHVHKRGRWRGLEAP